MSSQFAAFQGRKLDSKSSTVGRRLPGESRDAVAVAEADGGTSLYHSPFETLNQADPKPTCDRYVDLTCIASGGMGRIYRARDSQLNRDVALKVLPAGRESDTVLQRFLTESRVLAHLQHPGIPPVHEEGWLPDGRPFIAMKLVHGHSLRSLLDERADGNDDLARFIGIFRQICETIAFAHSRRVLHRDLKPENVMVGAFGEVQVIDWGIAKQRPKTRNGESSAATISGNDSVDAGGSPPAAAADPFHTPNVTIAGGPLGTPGYMPPEQAWGCHSEACEASDIFSLGCLLFEILTGHVPFPGWEVRRLYEASRQELLDAVDQSLAECQVDDELKDLVRSCLRPLPKDRPQSAGDLVEQLDARHESVENRIHQIAIERVAESERRKRRRLTTGFVVCSSLLLALAAGGWAIVSQNKSHRRQRAVAAVSKAVGEAEHSRDNALKNPLNDIREWRQAQEAVGRAGTVASQVGDETLRRQVQTLADEIARLSAVAARDRKLVQDLVAAAAPVPINEVRKRMKNNGDDGHHRRHRPPHGFGPPPHHHRGHRHGQGDFADHPHPPHHPPPHHRHPPHERGGGKRPSGTGEGPSHSQNRAHYEVLRSRYLAAFSAYELNPKTVSAKRAAARLQARPPEVQEAVVAGMDRWLGMMIGGPVDDSANAKWLVAVLKVIDANDERTGIRESILNGDGEALRVVAAKPHLLEHPASFVWLVARQQPTRTESITLIRLARKRYPGSHVINLQLADDFQFLGEDERAVEAFLAALAVRQDAQICIRTALLLLKMQRYDEAAILCRNAIRLDPVKSDGYTILTKTLLEQKQPRRALKVAQRGLKELPKDSPQYSRLLLKLARAQESVGQYEKALKTLESILELDNVPAHVLRGAHERIRDIKHWLSLTR